MAPSPKTDLSDLICRWENCDEEFENGEDLYAHLCSVHVGRKSSGTLTLECKWSGCTAKASKRDHLTSHLRCHSPLKPHSCPVCSKSFKRPQDLKKHEKIHTEQHHLSHKHSKAVTVSEDRLSPPIKKKSPSPAVQPVPAAYYSPPPPPLQQHQQQPPFNFYPAPPPLVPFYDSDIASLVSHQQQLNAERLGYSTLQYDVYGNPMMPFYGDSTRGQNPYQSFIAPNNHEHNYQPSPYSLPDSLSSLYPSMPSIRPPYQSQIRRNNGGPSPAGSSASQSPRQNNVQSPSTGSAHSPDQSDLSERKSLAGTKRGFEEAAGGFIANLVNKRFQDGDRDHSKKGFVDPEYDAIGSQLDALSTFLLTPSEIYLPAHSPESQDGSTGSDYSREEVDSLNELLVSLGEQTEEQFSPSYGEYEQPAYIPPPPANAMPSSFGSLYPSFKTTPTEYLPPVPHRAAPYSFEEGGPMIRYSKSSTVPTILPIEGRTTIHRNIERLARAAPSRFTSEPEMMEGMEMEEDLQNNKLYNSSLRSTSTSLDSVPSTGIELAPIHLLNNKSTEEVSDQKPSLPSIILPPIRQLNLDPISDEESSALSRPASSSGLAVERLTQRVVKLKMKCQEEEGESNELSYRRKKFRTESYDEQKSSEQKRNRLLVLKNIVILINSNFRKSCAVSSRVN